MLLFYAKDQQKSMLMQREIFIEMINLLWFLGIRLFCIFIKKISYQFKSYDGLVMYGFRDERIDKSIRFANEKESPSRKNFVYYCPGSKRCGTAGKGVK